MLNNCKKCDIGLDVFQIDEPPKLMVKGREVGINDLDGIMKEVHELDLPEEHVGRELLEHVKRKDYIPPLWKMTTCKPYFESSNAASIEPVKHIICETGFCGEIR